MGTKSQRGIKANTWGTLFNTEFPWGNQNSVACCMFYTIQTIQQQPKIINSIIKIRKQLTQLQNSELKGKRKEDRTCFVDDANDNQIIVPWMIFDDSRPPKCRKN